MSSGMLLETIVLGITVLSIIVVIVKLFQIQNLIKSSPVVQSITDNMDSIVSCMDNLKEKYGQISNQLLTLNNINDNTMMLKSYLTNPRTRGMWGERMVEDIINLAGLQEHVNYVKQSATAYGRPDFTFFLPNGKSVNLDAKFPLNNYMKYIDAQNEIDKQYFKKAFLQDVKRTIIDVSKRDYINENTVDFVIVFIASEAVYSFLLSENPGVIDEALRNKVVLCSPNNLYAVLSVIRQASNYYTLEKKSKELLSVIYRFNKEWQNFATQLEKMGTKIDSMQKLYGEINGTRKNKLDSILSEVGSINKNYIPDKSNQKTVEIK